MFIVVGVKSSFNLLFLVKRFKHLNTKSSGQKNLGIKKIELLKGKQISGHLGGSVS